MNNSDSLFDVVVRDQKRLLEPLTIRNRKSLHATRVVGGGDVIRRLV